MASTFCVVGATRGTGLQIASQLLQRGKHVRVVARDPEKARLLRERGTPEHLIGPESSSGKTVSLDDTP